MLKPLLFLQYGQLRKVDIIRRLQELAKIAQTLVSALTLYEAVHIRETAKLSKNIFLRPHSHHLKYENIWKGIK